VPPLPRNLSRPFAFLGCCSQRLSQFQACFALGNLPTERPPPPSPPTTTSYVLLLTTIVTDLRSSLPSSTPTCSSTSSSHLHPKSKDSCNVIWIRTRSRLSNSLHFLVVALSQSLPPPTYLFPKPILLSLPTTFAPSIPAVTGRPPTLSPKAVLISHDRLQPHHSSNPAILCLQTFCSLELD
jgi:hypothetical protein